MGTTDNGRCVNKGDVAYCYGIYLTLLIFAGCVTLHVGAWYDYEDIQKLFAQNGTRVDAWNSLPGMDNLIPPHWIQGLFMANYAFQLLWILYTFAIPCRDAAGRQVVRKSVSGGVLVLFVLSCGCIIAWLFLWDRGWFNYSVILMFAASLYAYLGLFQSLRGAAKEYAIMRKYLYSDLIAIRVLVHNGLGLQATLCLTIAFYQICEILTQQGVVTYDVAFVFVAALLAVKIFSFSAEACDCLRIQNYVMTSYFVVIVECVAIIIEWLSKGRSISEPKSLALIIVCAIIIALCFLFSLIKVGMTYQRETDQNKSILTGPKTTVASFDNSGYGRFEDLESNPGTDVMDAKTRSSYVADSDFTVADGAVSETTLPNTNIVHFGGARTMGDDNNVNGNNGTFNHDGEALLAASSGSRTPDPEGSVNGGLNEEEREAEYRKMSEYLDEDVDEEVDEGRGSSTDGIEGRLSTSEPEGRGSTSDPEGRASTAEPEDAYSSPTNRWQAHLTNGDTDSEGSDTVMNSDNVDGADTHTHVTFQSVVPEDEQKQLVNDDKRASSKRSSSRHSDTDANMLSSRDRDFDDEPAIDNHQIVEE